MARCSRVVLRVSRVMGPFSFAAPGDHDSVGIEMIESPSVDGPGAYLAPVITVLKQNAKDHR